MFWPLNERFEKNIFVLDNGLKFCIPPKPIKGKELFAEFKILHAQLTRHNISDPLEFNKLPA